PAASSLSRIGDGGWFRPSCVSSNTGRSRSRFGKKSSRLFTRASVVGRFAQTSFSTNDFLLESFVASDDSHPSDGVAAVLREPLEDASSPSAMGSGLADRC